MTEPPLMGPPSASEWADAARAVLRDWLADGRLSDGVLRRLQSLVARHGAAGNALMIPVPPADARPLMPPDRRLPPRADDLKDLSDEEREWLVGFARNGVASQRVWKVVVLLCGGLAAVVGAIAAVITLGKAIGPGH